MLRVNKITAHYLVSHGTFQYHALPTGGFVGVGARGSQPRFGAPASEGRPAFELSPRLPALLLRLIPEELENTRSNSGESTERTEETGVEGRIADAGVTTETSAGLGREGAEVSVVVVAVVAPGGL